MKDTPKQDDAYDRSEHFIETQPEQAMTIYAPEPATGSADQDDEERGD